MLFSRIQNVRRWIKELVQADKGLGRSVGSEGLEERYMSVAFSLFFCLYWAPISLSLSLSLSFSRSLSLSHTHTHTHTHSVCLSISLSLFSPSCTLHTRSGNYELF